MKITINFTKTLNDERMTALAKAYWRIEPNGEWTFKIKELAAQYGVSYVKAHSIVASICNVTSQALTCTQCLALRPALTRSGLMELIQDYEYAKRRPNSNAFFCTVCKSEERLQLLAEIEIQKQAEESKIINWLDKCIASQEPKRYKESPLLDAFLINGLLRYVGDEWSGAQLDSWNQYKPHLCPFDSDAANAYEHLYKNGWIVPDVNSPLDAFSVSDDDRVEFDILRVNWYLASDADGAPYDQIVAMTDQRLFEAASDEILEIWQWTCMRELRAHFEYCNDRYNFTVKGWTQKIEQQLMGLLDDRSLAEAKSIVYKCITNLKLLMHDSEYKRPHVLNMLPGSFSLLSNKYRANGWSFQKLPRMAIAKEAIYTRHLFDHVLGGGTDLYFNLTGNKLRQLS